MTPMSSMYRDLEATTTAIPGREGGSVNKCRISVAYVQVLFFSPSLCTIEETKREEREEDEEWERRSRLW